MVIHVLDLDFGDDPQPAGTDDFGSLLVMRPTSLLHTDQHDTTVLLRSLDCFAALADGGPLDDQVPQQPWPTRRPGGIVLADLAANDDPCADVNLGENGIGESTG